MMDNPEIIIIEDNYHDLEMIQDAFRELRIKKNMCVLRDGVEATHYFFDSVGGLNFPTTTLPKLILLDLQLPRVNGMEVLRKLKMNEQTRSLPVVVFTSSNEESDRINSYNLGANSYLVKPMDADEYFSYIENIIKYWVGMNVPAK
jgi:two-component system response regulator